MSCELWDVVLRSFQLWKKQYILSYIFLHTHTDIILYRHGVHIGTLTNVYKIGYKDYKAILKGKKDNKEFSEIDDKERGRSDYN